MCTEKFYSSLPFAYFIDALSSASYFRQFSFEDSDRTGTYEMNLDIQVQKYFQETHKFFYFVSPDALMRKGFDRPQSDVILGLGYGRFINATALRKAVRIEDFLFEEGVISDFLPKDTMITLGQIIEKEDEYRNIHGDRTYLHYWYEDMSSEIDKTGLVTGGVILVLLASFACARYLHRSRSATGFLVGISMRGFSINYRPGIKI